MYTLKNSSHSCIAILILVTAVVVSYAHDDPAQQAVAPSYWNKSAGGSKSNPHQNPAYDLKGIIAGEPLDEAKSGRTLLGTPVTPRTVECFPAEPRDLFWQMDWVAGKDGRLVPLDFDEDMSSQVDPVSKVMMSGITDGERDGIRGRNTWLLWGGGNEAFWGWLQERGYGLTDYLILMDSRQRANRFKTGGLINQPGFASNSKPFLGLYLDQPKDGDWRNAMLRPPPSPDEWQGGKLVRKPYPGSKYGPPEPELYDAQGRKLEKPIEQPQPPPNHPTQLFEPWTTLAEWEKDKKDASFKDYIPEVVRAKLPQDGLDPAIYGYPSGIFGLRLMLNPDFFAKTRAAEIARNYWKQQVEGTNGRYYTDKSINADPKLVRPFRVTMSCGFCHVAQHPLNPPLRDDEPEWENLSSIIGAQYWDPQAANANLQKPPGFLYHFLKSQAPGTIDTSLVSTDHINNTNVINPIFDVPARLERAMKKPAELQSRTNLMLPSIEDPETSENPDGSNKLRHFPMVLGPGEDSVGVFGALERVPHNVGVFPEMWFTTGNLVLGYTPQRPFRLEVGRANSVYWNVNVKYRVPYMAKFFDLGYQLKVPKSTAPMKLKDAQDVPRDPDRKPILDANGNPQRDENGKLVRQPAGKMILEQDTPARRDEGRKVFLDNCAICHSSKLPEGFNLQFTREVPKGGWLNAPGPKDPKAPTYILPMEYSNWEDFRNSPAMADFRERIHAIAGLPPKANEDDEFIKNNFLSNELRIPITLVGTYAGRSLATNAMRGNVWDNYSSETFKKMESVGAIRYFNPYMGPENAKLDPYGTNAEFTDGRAAGGPGYFRPATLISIWASAPFFHNNALGIYTHETSVRGRMLAFDDAIRKLLWNKERTGYNRKEPTADPLRAFTYIPPGDLRPEGSGVAANDPGYIYRLPVDTHIQFQPGFTPLLIKNLLAGFVGRTSANILFSILSFWIWVVLSALFVFLIFRGRSWHAGAMLLFLGLILFAVILLLELGGVLWLVAAILASGGVGLLLARGDWKVLTRATFIIATVVTIFTGILTNKFLNGRLQKGSLVAAILPNSWRNVDYQGIDLGPIPRGTPVNLLMNLDPDLKKIDKVAPAVLGLTRALVKINRENLVGEEAYKVFSAKAAPALMAASKCPDFVLDRGHWFGEPLTDAEKEALIAFLKTL